MKLLFPCHKKICDESYNIEISVSDNSELKYSKAIEVNVIGRSLKLIPWLWFTSFISLIAVIFRVHQAHPSFLISIIITHLLVLGYRIQSKVVSEKLIVISGLGVQTTLTFLTGKCRTRFIPWFQLIDMIIAETITMQQVLFFMAILIKSDKSPYKEELYPLFLHCWPKLYCLQEIYRYCQETLSCKSSQRNEILYKPVPFSISKNEH